MTDQMIEKAVFALGHDDDCAGDCDPESPHCHVWLRMTVALDALMPEVDSLEALEALPVGTKLLSSDGTVWWSHSKNVGWFRCTKDEYGRKRVDVFADHGPLRVIWTPEAAE